MCSFDLKFADPLPLAAVSAPGAYDLAVELEADGLVNRIDFDEIIPHVEYSLTVKGKRALPMLTNAAEWAVKEMGFENIKAYCKECANIS